MEMGNKFKVMGMIPATMTPILDEIPVYGFKSYNLID